MKAGPATDRGRRGRLYRSTKQHERANFKEVAGDHRHPDAARGCHLGSCVPGGRCIAGDLDQNCSVSINDLLLLLSNWG